MLMSKRAAPAADNRPKSKETLVSLSNAGIRRDGRWLVRGVEFDIARGEVVTLIGPNGAGKSTTAKMAIGVLKADEGSVTRKRDLRIGYVPQKLAIDWTMPLSVRRLMTLTGPLKDTEIATALEATGIAHLANSEVRHLSGGEFQRALLARAIARKPDLMVLDEPVQGVDFAGEAALYDLIRTIRNKTGCGILMISHDLHMVMAGTDTVICLNGHVCCRGTPEVVSQSSDYMKLFGGNARSLAVYNHHHDHTHLPDGRVRHSDGSITEHCHPEDGHHHDHSGHDHDHGHSHDHAHGDHAHHQDTQKGEGTRHA
ncbi:metal ABC transporter ATP-binding protein [Agrobacterium sp. Ap1]|uniref:ATP-binding cassette domain-containing protein n=1 Tax=Agrobacterium sp. Ap1 TaxID=2815337 RepID=UPI001A8E6DF9|nr:metal ABC transporter ATP-binding protein [Agrobacterium sp. Ap1]MBO0141664.1 metal ABC transporter ATP-binding protein [Agrobacterium sp. Ap1]